MKFNLVLFPIIAFFLCNVTFAQKKAIDEAAYADWKRVDSYSLSQDGRYVTYKYSYISNPKKNKELEKKYYLFDNVTKKSTVLDSVSNINFAAGGKWMTFEKAGKSMLMRMKDKKVIEWTREGSPSFELGSSVVSYRSNAGKDQVYYNLDNGDSIVYKGIGRVTIFGEGQMMMYQKDCENSSDLCYGKIAKGAKHTTLYSDKTKTLSSFNLNRDNTGNFSVASKDGDKENCNLIYKFSIVGNKVELCFNSDDIKLDAPLYMENGAFGRDFDGKYISFDVYPTKPTPKKKYDKSKRDDSFELELWCWNDSISQSVQAISGIRDMKMKPYVYVYNTQTKKYYPVVTDNYSVVTFSNDNNSDFAFFTDELPYSKRDDWEHDPSCDIYLVDLRTGEKQLFAKETTTKAKWSPKGDYIYFYDADKMAWMSLEPKTFTLKDISSSIGQSVADLEYDKPNARPSHGITGWSKDGRTVYINDEFDIWAVDIAGIKPATCLTKGYGRTNGYTIRFINPDYADIVVDPKQSNDVYLYGSKTSDAEIATMLPGGKFVKNAIGEYAYKVMKSSSDLKTYLYQKQSYKDDRDLWISDSKFRKPYRVTHANPQQKDYNWGSVQIVEWTNYDGVANRGLLFLPEDYKKGKSYPTIVNFYETHTGEKNIYHAPSYSPAMLDVTTYVSNGYIIFMPDVNFKIGEPGKSSYNAVVSGTKDLIEKGIIDPKRVGLQGHSWSGYQTAYLVTKTDMFTCVNIGAPIVNMTSAYNGVREGSGMPRMFMYEDWQCRMGKPMWDILDKYIESSPVLYADKIKTPTLIFHCDKDEAVSFYEGRSLFLALRRLQVPAWMTNYKGEGHFVNKPEAMADWSRRMQQFFDHYLNNTPMPRWMAEGINVNERGYDQKFDFVK